MSGDRVRTGAPAAAGAAPRPGARGRAGRAATRRRWPRALLLDAMGTLLALVPPAPALRRELARRLALTVSIEDAERAIAAEISYYLDHHDEGRDRASLAALRLACAEQVRAALGEAAAGLTADELVAPLLAALRFRAFPDALAALPRARERGIALVVVSNWDASLHDALAQTGLAQLVDGAVSSAQAGAAKPDPAIFERALALAGVAPAEALHAGDSLERDVAGARAAGIEPVLVARDGGPAPAGVRSVRSLAQLPGLDE